MAVTTSNVYKANFEDLTELSATASSMKGAITALIKAQGEEPVQIRRTAKGVRTIEDDKPVTISITVDEGGSVVPTTFSTEVDQTVYFYATPAEHYSFKEWQDANGESLGVSGTLAYAPTEEESGKEVSIKAVFTADEQFTALFSVDGNGSVTSASITAYNNEKITNTAIPMDNNVFVGWYANEELLSENPTLTLVLTEDVTIKAQFAEKPSTAIALTVDMPTGTTAYVAPDTIIAYAGDKIPLYAVSTDTATFDHWEDEDGGNLGNDNPLYYTVPDSPVAAMTFKAVFTEV